jgi:hypothetical protein
MSAEPVGSLAEEAAKLIAVMQGWASEHAGDPGHAADDERPAPGANEPGHPVGATDDPGHGHARQGRRTAHADHDPAVECRWCPLCQTVRVAKAASPEVREHLASAAMSLAMAFKGLMETVDDSTARPSPFEKIDLDLEPDVDLNSPED